MKTFSIRTKGLQQVLSKWDRLHKDKVDAVDNELSIAARNIEASARSRAPRGKGNLAGRIHAETGQRFRKAVGVNDPIAAYVEFGTGVKVFKGTYSFSAEQKDFAKLFYVSGKGRSPSHAFLFPAFSEEIPQLTTRIKKALFGR